MPRNFDREAADERRAAAQSDVIMGFDAEPQVSPPKPAVVPLLASLLAQWKSSECDVRIDQMRQDAKLLLRLISRANVSKFYAAQELAARLESIANDVERHLRGKL